MNPNQSRHLQTQSTNFIEYYDDSVTQSSEESFKIYPKIELTEKFYFIFLIYFNVIKKKYKDDWLIKKDQLWILMNDCHVKWHRNWRLLCSHNFQMWWTNILPLEWMTCNNNSFYKKTKHYSFYTNSNGVSCCLIIWVIGFQMFLKNNDFN